MHSPARGDTLFWINASSSDAGSPGIGSLDAAGGTGYIWGRPDGGETLADLSLNLVSDSAAVELTGVNTLNPVIAANVGFPPKDVVRYEFDSPGTVSASAATGFGGFSVTNQDRIGFGMGPNTGASAPAGFQDPNYDVANDAFLIASFDYSTMGDVSNAGLWLQIGSNGLFNAGGRSADVNVVFGDLGDPALNGASDREVNSATVDAVFVGEVPPPGIPGDANGDTAVNLLDFQILSDNFGVTGSGTLEMGDFNGDRNINLLDFNILKENFGAELPVPVSAFGKTEVPEPASILLLAIGFGLLCTCRFVPWTASELL